MQVRAEAIMAARTIFEVHSPLDGLSEVTFHGGQRLLAKGTEDRIMYNMSLTKCHSGPDRILSLEIVESEDAYTTIYSECRRVGTL